MKPAPKRVLAIAPQSVTAAATVTGTIDCLGYDYLTLDIGQTSVAAATNKLSTCKISESDDTNATNFSDITALVGGGAGGFAIPNADTQNPQLYAFNLDLKKRKRYLKVSLAPQTTQTLWAQGQLELAEASPTQASDAGTALFVAN